MTQVGLFLRFRQKMLDLLLAFVAYKNVSAPKRAKDIGAKKLSKLVQFESVACNSHFVALT